MPCSSRGHEPLAPPPAVAHPDLERLHAALAQLSAKERLVITLLELEDRSVQEVAELTGWSAANVKVRAFRARGVAAQTHGGIRMNDPHPDPLDALFAPRAGCARIPRAPSMDLKRG